MEEWRTASNAALSEVRRLFSDGVPIMTRNVVPWLLADSRGSESGDGISALNYPDGTAFSETWGDITVDVGSVYYEKNFEVSKKQMTLKEYDVTAAAAAAAPAETASGKRYSPAPDFVFQRDTEVVGEGLELLGKFVEAALFPQATTPSCARRQAASRDCRACDTTGGVPGAATPTTCTPTPSTWWWQAGRGGTG